MVQAVDDHHATMKPNKRPYLAPPDSAAQLQYQRDLFEGVQIDRSCSWKGGASFCKNSSRDKHEKESNNIRRPSLSLTFLKGSYQYAAGPPAPTPMVKVTRTPPTAYNATNEAAKFSKKCHVR